MTEKEMDTVDNMAKMGGSFVKSLSECFLSADPQNFMKLKECFSNYWKTYSQE